MGIKAAREEFAAEQTSVSLIEMGLGAFQGQRFHQAEALASAVPPRYIH